MMIHGRTKHVQNLDRDSYMRTMAETAPKKDAIEWMRRKPYAAASLIRNQGEQMERKTVDEYLRSLSKNIKG